jgi:replicative DNA helicase
VAKQPQPTEKGMPSAPEAERAVLGSVLLNPKLLANITLTEHEFSLDANRRLYKRMRELEEDQEPLDLISVMNCLIRYGEVDAVGGATYITSLSDGLPIFPNIDNYIAIVREKATLRQIIFTSQHSMNQALSGEYKAEEILESTSKKLAQLEVNSGKAPQSLNPLQIMEEHGGLASFMQGAIDPGISFGFPQFDEYMLGLQEGCQYIIAGRTRMGKSAMAMNMAVSLAKRGIPVEFLSLEMTKEILLARALCGEAKVPLKAYIRKDLTSWQREQLKHAGNELAPLPLYIDDASDMTISDILQKVNRAVYERNCRVFFLDHASRVNWAGERGMRNMRDEYSGMTAVSWCCCVAARKHKISSVVLCQLSRPSDKKKADDPPQLHDLRASGAWEQDATAVAMIHRPEVFKPGDLELKGVADLYIRKSRNGSEGVAKLTFKSSWVTFSDEGKPETEPAEEE